MILSAFSTINGSINFILELVNEGLRVVLISRHLSPENIHTYKLEVKIKVNCKGIYKADVSGNTGSWATLGHALEGHTLTLLARFYRKVRCVVLATGVRV